MQNSKKDSAGKLIVLGIQHVFAMFGATVLVPALTGLSPSTALLCAGLGTLLFHLITGRKVPVYLGSSFAFIAAIVAVARKFALPTADGLPAAIGSAEYMAGLPYATGGIIVAGALYVVLAILVKIFGADRIRSFFPPVVTGPMVVIIGMMLAPTAISSITTEIAGVSLGVNWLIALVTILAIIGVTLFGAMCYIILNLLADIIIALDPRVRL